MIRGVAHLIDDQSFGGINRMLDFLATDLMLAQSARHKIVRVKRGQLSSPQLEADIIVSHLSLSWANLPFLTMLRGLHPDTPIVHIEHSYCERFVTSNVFDRDRFEAMIRTCLSLVDHVVAVSAEQGAWMKRRGFCPAEKLSIIEPCVDLSAYLGATETEPSHKLKIGAIGRFDTQKGFDILINGFKAAQRSDLELHFYGDGPQGDVLRAAAQGEAGIYFHGFTPDVPAAMQACDLIAMPSRWEPFGLVALEAMAAQRPVLTTKTDGLATHIGVGAQDIGENTSSAWAEALKHLSLNDLYKSTAACRDHAEGAGKRFASNWSTLIETVTSAGKDTDMAA